jgi:hypothetical protein
VSLTLTTTPEIEDLRAEDCRLHAEIGKAADLEQAAFDRGDISEGFAAGNDRAALKRERAALRVALVAAEKEVR